MKLNKLQRSSLVGKRFGKWLVISKSDNKSSNGTYIWNCLCDCGNNGQVKTNELNLGASTKCKKCAMEYLKRINTTHGMTKTTEYNSWKGMIQRCTNPDDPSYKDWGGRGVTVCDRWLIFSNFLEDMGEKPQPGLTIERKKNNLGYFKENCEWATKMEQSLNRRSTVLIEYKGEKMVQSHWARRFGVDPSSISQRLRKGVPFDEIVRMLPTIKKKTMYHRDSPLKPII